MTAAQTTPQLAALQAAAAARRITVQSLPGGGYTVAHGPQWVREVDGIDALVEVLRRMGVGERTEARR